MLINKDVYKNVMLINKYVYKNVMLINKYVFNSVGLEAQLYYNPALPQIMGLINVTQDDIAFTFGVNDRKDGILNIMMREGIRYKDLIDTQEASNPSLFTSLGYLVFDIIVDVLLFLIIKVFFLGEIDHIHENFLGLNKCFTFHGKIEPSMQ